MLEVLDVTTSCRGCGSPDRRELLRLGEMPLADSLVGPGDFDRAEPRYPLTILYCPNCWLVQTRENVAPEVLFGSDYPYYSSGSEGWVEHCRENAHRIVAERGLDASSLVVEIGCNDGAMLQAFREKDVPVLGIDPASGPAAEARAGGIEVIEAFFTRAFARQLDRKADVVIANNVLAHAPDLAGFIAGIRDILEPSGLAVLEVPYVGDLIEKRAFDAMHHAHHCYFSVTSLRDLLRQAGLFLNDVERIDTHGGSVRLFVETRGAPLRSVDTLVREEKGLERKYYGFADRVGDVQRDLVRLLQHLKREGHRIAAYGAGAKGTILLNASGIGSDLVEYVVDRNEHKQGRYLPGVHLPVYGPERLLTDAPGYLLLLAWNHADEIMEQQAEFHRRGGRFIVPIPVPEVLG